MKAIVQDKYGAPQRVLKLEEIDRPSVGDDDVLIHVRATSVNTPDWITVAGIPYIIRLKFGLRKPPTPVRGTDIAGVVEAVGKNVTDLQPGAEVFGSSWADTLATLGTFAELTVAPASKLIKKPVGLTFEEAAASVMSGLTAMIAMRDVGRVGPGTRVLINGASGGVGTSAVQIAKALGGEVTGVCSTSPNISRSSITGSAARPGWVSCHLWPMNRDSMPDYWPNDSFRVHYRHPTPTVRLPRGSRGQ